MGTAGWLTSLNEKQNAIYQVIQSDLYYLTGSNKMLKGTAAPLNHPTHLRVRKKTTQFVIFYLL